MMCCVERCCYFLRIIVFQRLEHGSLVDEDEEDAIVGKCIESTMVLYFDWVPSIIN